MASTLKLEKKEVEQIQEKEIGDPNKTTTVKCTQNIRRNPKRNLKIPTLSDRAEKRRAIEQSDSDDETPEERQRRIKTEWKHRARLKMKAEAMFDLETDKQAETPSKQAKIKGDPV